MMTIPGYALLSPVCEGSDLALYRATRTLDGLPVLLKLPTADRPEPPIVRRLEREYELARGLDSTRVAHPLALERHGGQVALVLEQGPTETLASRLGSPMDLASFLQIAIDINAALAELHRHDLIHKDIKPEHVLLDATGHVWLTGLGMASSLPRERQAPEAPGVIAGTLAYMAPEQTGRMNRSVDSRSDLYALGTTFYEMLTGVLPFSAAGTMEWVHCQIARQPLPPSHRARGLPEPLSDLVMRLLAKNAEDRYQSTGGLDADLRRCQAEWGKSGNIERFPLGRHDASARLLIPEKLYGRSAEIDALLAAFGRVVAGGAPELVLVSGYSGIGKTSVVHELHKELVPSRGLFASGKFDQYKRDIPYATLVQALQALVRQILSRSEAELGEWRDAMRKSVSPNGQLIVGLIPEVELIIGKQPPAPDVAPREAQNRFRMVLSRFLGVFARPEHPLALFLDDLHWLDAATLDLIEQLMTGQEVRHLLLIGAYRDNAVGPAHPLRRILEAIRKRGSGAQEIVLAPLVTDDVGRLVADSLHCDRERALPLARLVHEKTGGNPFFVIQFLTALADEKLLAFDPGAGRWAWDLAGIHAKGHTHNVVDLMVGRLRRLPAESLEALQVLACLGNVAEIAALTTVCGLSEEALHAALWPAVTADLLFRHGKSYTFPHDRVQEAVYAMVPADHRKAQHLAIGRLPLAQCSGDVPADRVFVVVEQLNLGVELIADAGERAALRRLNAVAGKKARAAVAYASARRYLEQAVALLPANPWNEQHAETMALFTELAECEYHLGSFQHSDDLLTLALEKARVPLDRVRVYRLRQQLYQCSGRWQEAVSAALDGLLLLGVSFPASDEDLRAATEAEERHIQANLRGRPVAELADAPFTDDAEVRALIGLLAESITLSFITRPVLWHLVVLKCVNLCLERGQVQESPCIYSSYCKMLVAMYNDIPSAFEFSKMSLKLNERLEGGAMRGLPPFFHASVVSNWCQHFETNLHLFDRAFEAFLDSGDIVWASYLSYNAVWLHLENGDPLEHVIELARHYAAFNQRSHNDIVYLVDRVEEQFARSLQGKTRSLTDFSDGFFDEAASAAAIERASFGIGVAYYRIMKQISAFIAGRFDEALGWAERVVPVLASVSSMAIWGTHSFYHALTRAALHGRAGEGRRREVTGELADVLGQLRYWADNCPENFGNRYDLVSAEVARIEGRDLDAMRLYDQAIRSARDNRFVHQEALAAEVASRFYRARGFDRFADDYLRDARACYSRWGAQGKVRQIEQDRPQLQEGVPRLTPIGTVSTGAQDMDILAVVRASQAISGEILLDGLLKTLMRIVLENAGARHGYLLLSHGDELSLAAAAHVEGQSIVVQVCGEVALPDATLPASILNYVSRCRDKVLLEDATLPSPYSADEYFASPPPSVRRKSVLCFPIVKQARLVGVLYLENDLVTGAFTPGRLAVLELLAAQAAISRENAALYADLGRNVAALRQAERERITRLRFVESADRINRAIQGAPDVDAMMTDTLDAVLDIFECDRAFLLHPCDPDAPTWQVPMERTRPEYPGLFVRGTEAPMDDDVARTLRVLLASDGPVRFGPDMEHPTPREVSERFGIRAFLSMALRPKVGPPWQFGIHQCSHVRVWQPEDVLLLQEIGRRLADGLTSLLMLRELRRSEEALRRSERRKTILNAVANVFLTVPDDEMYGRVLDEVLAVMRSRFGFFGFIAESGDFVVPSLTRGIWDHCSVEEKSTVFPPSAWGASLWGKAIREQRTQCSDGPFHTPEGHFVLEHVLAVPVTRGTDTIGLLCVANGERSYAGEDRELLESIAGNISPILDARLRREWQEQKRKQAEEALRKLSRAVEQSPASIVVTDTAGKIEYVNPKFTEIAGYTSEEVLGENPRLLKSGEMSLSTYEVLWRTITAGKTWHGEFHNRKKSGELFWALASISPITDADGKITHYVAVAEDITARKGLEDQLRQAQKMEAVGQLAGGVAHNFNNILTATLMTISMLRDDPQLTEDVSAGLEDLDCHARRAASLTRQLLLFSRRQSIEARPVDLNEVVTNLSKMLRRLIGEDIDLAVRCPRAPLMAHADPGMLEQVLMNLCVNARDAMPRGGTLSIATSRVELDGEPSPGAPEGRGGSFVCLSVADSGCGMDDETKARIFEPFFTTKEVGKGTGLGLATVYGVVKQHRGWIQVESAVDRGTVFKVYLPARQEPTEQLQAPTLASVRGGTETILLVEDDPSMRRLAASCLRNLGYAVFEAGNGVEAMTAWEQLGGRFDLLLTDMVMPGGMTGLDLAERLRRESAGLRVILVSGHSREKVSGETLAATGIVFVAKPYDAVVLAGSVRACLDRGKTPGPTPSDG